MSHPGQPPPRPEKPQLGKDKPPTPKEKRFIGVPVLPGLPAHPPPIQIENSTNDFLEAVAHMEETTSIGSAQSLGATAAAEPLATRPPIEHKWKLHHVDFMPAPTKEKGKDDYDKFPKLLHKANVWLADHPHAVMFSCETMTWMSVDGPFFSDNGIITKSFTTDKKTKFMRGIRIWYFVLDDTFYEIKSASPPANLGYINYLPEGKNDVMSNLVKRLSDDMFKSPVRGKIMKVETLHLSTDVGDADATFWREEPDKNKHLQTFLRVYFMESPDDARKYGEIGIKDFIPQYDQRTVHNQGYEVYADIWKKAARWLHSNPSFSCISIQSVFTKYKKDESEMMERCQFKEHGSAHGSMGAGKTEYLQVLRLAYARSPQQDSSEPSPRKLFYKTFAPARLKKPGSGGGEEELSESSYEDMRQAEEKINAWLHFSGAKVLCVESIPTRLRSGGQETLGPEATFVYNTRDKNPRLELWKYNIRLFLEGEFKEVPITWTKQIIEQSSTIKTSSAAAT